MTFPMAPISTRFRSRAWSLWIRTTLLVTLMVLSSTAHASSMTWRALDALTEPPIQLSAGGHCIACHGGAHHASECCVAGPCECISERPPEEPMIGSGMARLFGYRQTLAGLAGNGIDRPPKGYQLAPNSFPPKTG